MLQVNNWYFHSLQIHNEPKFHLISYKSFDGKMVLKYLNRKAKNVSLFWQILIVSLWAAHVHARAWRPTSCRLVRIKNFCRNFFKTSNLFFHLFIPEDYETLGRFPINQVFDRCCFGKIKFFQRNKWLRLLTTWLIAKVYSWSAEKIDLCYILINKIQMRMKPNPISHPLTQSRLCFEFYSF